MNHHPEHDLLEEYAAGTLAAPIALCVATHLSFCAHCKTEVQALQALSGILLEQLPPMPVSELVLQNVLTLIDQADTRSTPEIPDKVAAAEITDVPRALRKLVPYGYAKLPWSRVLPSLRIAELNVGDDDYTVALHRVKPGGRVAMHDHRGEEFTLVLNGSFSDEYGVYSDGDFILRGPSEKHRPLAAQNEECLCLAVQRAPVRFTGFFWRMLNPLLR